MHFTELFDPPEIEDMVNNEIGQPQIKSTAEWFPYPSKHWLNISSFSVKKLVKNARYFSHFFSLKMQVKTL
jgi:hypothetical protein